MNLAKFTASEEQKRLIENSFQPLIDHLELSGSNPGYLASVPASSGVYFVGATRNGELLKVYVGKASNLQRRMGDYHREFQVHSPNDAKMLFLQSWLDREDPGWNLCLRAMLVPENEISSVESKWISALNPIVNGTMRVDDILKAAVHATYQRYFHDYFTNRVLERSRP